MLGGPAINGRHASPLFRDVEQYIFAALDEHTSIGPNIRYYSAATEDVEATCEWSNLPDLKSYLLRRLRDSIKGFHTVRGIGFRDLCLDLWK
jgi:hypothetical protein